MLIPVIEPIIEPRTSHAGEVSSPVVSSIIEPIIEAETEEVETILIEPVIAPLIIPDNTQTSINNEGKATRQESVFLRSLPADTATTISTENLTEIDLVSVRDRNNRDITSSIIVEYSGNRMILQSSIELTEVKIRLIGRTLSPSLPEDAATGSEAIF